MLPNEIFIITQQAKTWPKWVPKSERYPNKPHPLPMTRENTHVSYALQAVLKDLLCRHSNALEPFANDPRAL